MGLASGLTIAVVIGGNTAGGETAWMILLLGGLGTVVGTLIGLLIRRISLRSSGLNGRP